MPGHFHPDHDACGVGFIAQIGGAASHQVLERAVEALRRLSHRGGVDADSHSGDGAGLLTTIPQAFICRRAQKAGIDLPELFGMGMVFLPPDEELAAKASIENQATKDGLRLLGWRTVPVDPEILGPRALAILPIVTQFFVTPALDSCDFQAQLFRFRKHAEHHAPRGTYFCSVSSRTVVYKGLLTPEQLPAFYLDLRDPEFTTSFAIFHQRYSTNTEPSWSLAQPFRFVAHNGEINTITSNRRWLYAKQNELRRELALNNSVSLLEEYVSDSASFDNAFEIQLQRGATPPEAMAGMVPPAWENLSCTQEERHFFEENAYRQEPWDGPAALVFSDGRVLGARLDRNGLRPLRYTITSDGLLVLGSEAGIADLHESEIVERQRLGPGEILLLDLRTGALTRPGGPLSLRTTEHVLPKRAIAASPTIHPLPNRDSSHTMAALGWTEDQVRIAFESLARNGQEAVWSMGDDGAPAALSDLQRPLWDYCKQRFAQVTNPPIDPLRERHVMSLQLYLAGRFELPSPVLTEDDLNLLRNQLSPVKHIDFTFPVAEGVDGALNVLKRLDIAFARPRLVVLSDRDTGEMRAALPALLALSAVWKTMVNGGFWNIPLVIETGQVIETHHVALLIAAGASAVVPYLAMEKAAQLSGDVLAYRTALENGLRRVIARMGISTIASYRNSQLFETVGLDRDVCETYFEDAYHFIGGKSLRDLLQDCIDRHSAAYGNNSHGLRDHGLYRFRHAGEKHANSPELVRRMHRFINSPSAENFRSLSQLAESREPVAIRDLFELVPGAEPKPISEIESQESILSRFSTQAMSLGAVSPETHRTLAVAMNRLGAKSNTGEGGEDAEIYDSDPEANNRVKQVASARFGVSTAYLINADELEIKIAQGAKPGEGGRLPANKVTVHIARLRHAIPNMTLISPPPHHDIYSIEDLAQLIFDLRAVNPRARIGVKLVSGAGVGIIAAGVAKAGADVITIAGQDGGTGASPLTSIKNTGLPWEIGLRDAHCTLMKAGLRDRVRLRVDGGLKFARDVVIAALLGADEFGFGTAALLAIGCVMARQCHLNTCPVGIATQDEILRARFAGKPEMVESYFRALADEVRALLSRLGAISIDEVVGQSVRLVARYPESWAFVADLLKPVIKVTASSRGLLRSKLPDTLEARSQQDATPVAHATPYRITTEDRALGARLSGELLRSGHRQLENTQYEFDGTAGQSFGAFLVKGLEFRLRGEANDYVGKGLSGGTIVISAGARASRRGDVLAGNTVLYGATSGELYLAGKAGERFAVRNSGALAVVEGVGHHACEYMTAGIVVVLGPCGPNFGAGMTGGLAYVLQSETRSTIYSQQSLSPEPLEALEEGWLRQILLKHWCYSESPRAAKLLIPGEALPFVRLQPIQPPCTVQQAWSAVLKIMPRPVGSHNEAADAIFATI